MHVGVSVPHDVLKDLGPTGGGGGGGGGGFYA